MSQSATQSFRLGNIYAAPISDLEVFAEPFEIHCAECMEANPEFILFASRLDRLEPATPNDPAFVRELRDKLGMDFYFCACSRHVHGWGTFSREVRNVTVFTSRPHQKAHLSFVKLT